MAQVIGKIGSLDGSFYIKSADGTVSIAKVGDTIYSGDVILGSSTNTLANKLTVGLNDNSKEIIILANNQQLFDETMLGQELSSDTVVKNDELNESLLLEATKGSEQKVDETNNQANLTLQDIENLDAAAAGADAAAGGDTTNAGLIPTRLEDRTGAEVDINTDLRDSTTTTSDITLDPPQTFIAPVDAVFSLIGDITVLEGTEGVTIGGSLNQTPIGTPLVITLSNGATITFGTDYVPGTIVQSTPFEIQGDDVYVDGETVTLTVIGTTGGGFASVDTTDSVDVNVVDTIDNITAKLVQVGAADGDENGYSVEYKVVLVDSDDNPVTVQAGQSVDVVVNITDANNPTAADKTHTFTISGGASESTTWTYSYANADPYIETESISAAIDGTSVTSTEGNFENITANTTAITTPLTDVTDTVVLKLNETLNSNGTYTYEAIVSNAPQIGNNLVITLNNGETITLTSANTTASITTSTQANSVTSITGGNYEDLKVIYGFGQDLTLKISANNQTNDIDTNTSYFDSDTITTEIALSSLKLTPQVDLNGFAINTNGEKLTSTDNIGTQSSTTYYIKYITNTSTNEVNAVRTDSNGNIISPNQIVFTITPDTINESYDVSLGTYPLDGSAYTASNLFDSSGSLGGGNAHSLLFNLNNLYVLATTTDASGSAGSATKPYTVNYSSGNGMGIEGGNSINNSEILYLNFTNSSIYTQMQTDLLVNTDQDGNLLLNSIDNREYARDNEQYLTQAIFGLKKWGSGDQAVWKAYNGNILIADGTKNYSSTTDKLIISSEITNLASTTAGITVLNNLITNTTASDINNVSISYSLDGGVTTTNASLEIKAGETINLDQFNEVRITAGAGDFSVASMGAFTTESIPPENQIINVKVETSNGTDITTGNMQITFDGDSALVGTSQDNVIDYTGATSIDGGAGNDTLVLGLDDGNIDFSALNAPDIKNIESIDLSSGNHNLTQLSLQDVIDMTGNSTDKILKITGDSGDAVNLTTDFTKLIDTNSNPITTSIDNVSYEIYQATSGTDTYKVLVQTEITDNIS